MLADSVNKNEDLTTRIIYTFGRENVDFGILKALNVGFSVVALLDLLNLV